MQKKSGHWTYTHGRVIGQAIVAKSFPSATRWGNINNQRITSNCYCAECKPMKDTQHDKYSKKTGQKIAHKNRSKQKIGCQIDWFTGEAVVKITHERANKQGRDGITT